MENDVLISQAALIEALMTYTWRDDDERLIDDADEKREFIKQWLPDVPAVDGWISVKDRLPGEEDYRQCHENWDGAVIWTNGSDIGLGWYYTSTGNWADIYDCNIDDVTHWMTLPEPPKEDNDAGQ